MGLGLKVAGIPCLIILLMSGILYSLSVPQAAHSYPVSIEKIGLKWSNLYFTICIFNAADQKYEDIFIKAIEEWKQAWPHFNYELAKTQGCSIDVYLLKDYAPYQEGGYLGVTDPTPNYNYDKGYWEFTSAKITIPTKGKYDLLQGGICCKPVYLERTDKEFYETAVHEFGHALGLGHSTDNGIEPVGIMHAKAGPPDEQYFISSLYIKTLDEIYGTSTNASDHPLGIKPSVMIEVKADKETYFFDEIMHVAGKVSKMGGNGYLMLIDLYENTSQKISNVYTFRGFDPNKDGSFDADLDLTTDHAGKYVLLVQYMGVSSGIIFEVKEIGYEVHAHTDKTAYSVGEVVKINGNVTRHGEGVDIYLINPKGTNFKFVKAPISLDRKFEAKFTLQESGLTTEGIWTIHMAYAGTSTDIHFSVVKTTAPSLPVQAKTEHKDEVSKQVKLKVNARQKGDNALITVKSSSSSQVDVFELHITLDSGKVASVKPPRGWGFDVDQKTNTIKLFTKDSPLTTGKSMRFKIETDASPLSCSWVALDKDLNEVASGSMKARVARA